MTKEEAGYMVGIAYIPVRYYRGFVSWQNEDSRLSKPGLWNFDEYYSALVHYSGIYQSEKEEKE